MEDSSSGRRYNTRFRGVPKSVFTYTRAKKSSTKSNHEKHLRKDIRDDYVYTRLGKKHTNENEPSNSVKIKIKTVSPPAKAEKRSLKSEVNSNTIPNGKHKSIQGSKEMHMKVKCQNEFEDKVSVSHDSESKNHIKTNTIEKSKIIGVQDLESKTNNVQNCETNEIEIPFSKIKTNDGQPFKNNHNHIKPSKIEDGITGIKIEQDDDLLSEMSPKSEKDMDGIFFEAKSSIEELHALANNGPKSIWIPSKERLSWNNCNVASYNPKTKMFRCVICQAVGFMSRIGEHYLGTHCNAKVFHCPQCSYCSAWWRCVRNHMSKNHGVSNAPASMWKNQPLLDEIMQILQNLKYSVDLDDRVERVAENFGKRYICPKCPYATDRRDLYNRHENIHREEKPFQCYICYKLFNRADHVKKHFCRIHKDFNYDINLIRRLPSKRSRIPVSPPFNGKSNPEVIFDNPPVPPSQTHLYNCLSGSPTMVKVTREIDNIPEYVEKKPMLSEGKNDNTFNKSHSNLLTFLTQNAFSPKPIKNTSKHIEPPKEILHDALLKPQIPPPPYQQKKFLCPYCPWTGPNMWALRLHTSMHYRTFCVLCNFKSSEAADLQNHMWECHKKRSCNKCNYLADSAREFDLHMQSVHGQKQQFSCRHCTQSFEVRSDMEAHCIFIHNQVLQECRDNGCDFCTTDPDVLKTHKREIHSSVSASQDTSASRTLCLYCGCDFADPQSLLLHEELFHENPLQTAGRRPLNPYGCSVCGYSTPRQPMMIEHMRIHTGQSLRCLAGADCHFTTPYDTVLREHVLQMHSKDDGCIRCPHCGFVCNSRFIFTSHYQEMHHPFCCELCESIEHRYFVLPSVCSSLDTNIAAMFPFAKQVEVYGSSSESPDKCIDDGGRRSRKQIQPRKIVPQGCLETKAVEETSKRRRTSSHSRERDKFMSLYVKKIRKLAQEPLLKCRLCIGSPIYFRNKRNYVFHKQWHQLKRFNCDKCSRAFCHRYQVLLHHRREHIETKAS